MRPNDDFQFDRLHAVPGTILQLDTNAMNCRKNPHYSAEIFFILILLIKKEIKMGIYNKIKNKKSNFNLIFIFVLFSSIIRISILLSILLLY